MPKQEGDRACLLAKLTLKKNMHVLGAQLGRRDASFGATCRPSAYVLCVPDETC